MKHPLAFVFGGGGARGALQVGAVRALLEADIIPDLLVGTSIGAANATFLAIHGVTFETVDRLEAAWHTAASLELMPSNYLKLATQAVFTRYAGNSSHRIQQFCVSNGLTPDICYGDIETVRLIVVAADLEFGKIVLYGDRPEQSVLEGVLASIALPPWFQPIQREGQYIVDGGVVSNVPIEPSLAHGAQEVIALNINDLREQMGEGGGLGRMLIHLLQTVSERQIQMELALAEAQKVRVRMIQLTSPEIVPIWDFKHTREMIRCGYEQTREAIESWEKEPQNWWEVVLEKTRLVRHLATN
jgi:NTE family protein